MRQHYCLGYSLSTNPSWWVYDAEGIPLCRVCEACKHEKLARYHPEILRGYHRHEVDEPIDEYWMKV